MIRILYLVQLREAYTQTGLVITSHSGSAIHLAVVGMEGLLVVWLSGVQWTVRESLLVKLQLASKSFRKTIEVAESD